MQVDFSVLNQKGNPAFYQDTFALRPAAGYSGRIFIATDTGNIYRDNGTTWSQIATGGGGGAVSVGVGLTGDGSVGNPLTSGIDTIMAAGELLTATRDLGLNGFNFRFMAGATQVAAIRNDGTATIGFSSNRLNITAVGNFTLGSANNHGIEHDSTTQTVRMGYFSGSNYPYIQSRGASNILQTYLGANQRGFYLDTSKTIVGNYGSNANCLYIDSNTISCKNTNSDGGLLLDFANNNWKFGDWNGFNAQTKTYLEIINASGGNRYAVFYDDININGLYLDYLNNTYQFGDLVTNQSKLVIDGSSTIFTLYNNSPISLDDNGTGTMLTSTAGSFSQYLVINVNGNPYKIELYDNA